jgi:hypothetical protein
MLASGKTQSAWCVEHGVNIRTFRYWAEKMKNGDKNKGNEPCWLKVVEYNPSLSEIAEASSGVEVLVGKYAVRINTGFDGATFARVCGLLSGLC